MPSDEPLLEDQEDGGHRPITPQERAVVDKCLHIVEGREKHLQQRGLDKTHFIIGVSNSLFVAWMHGGMPRHFWIVYIMEACVLFPLRWVSQLKAKPLTQQFYWLDFCWIANFMGSALCMLLVLFALLDCDPLSDESRKRCFACIWGLACGPLLLATGLVGNALIFHDPDNTASVLIHIFPSLVLYTFRWKGNDVHEAWPDIFHLDFMDEIDVWRDIYWCALVAYICWLVPYTFWLVLHGLGLPSCGYDTIFHANMRGVLGSFIALKVLGQSKEEFISRQQANDFSAREAFVYMLFHAVSVAVGILVSLPCFLSKPFNSALCTAMVAVTVYNGGSRYTYYMVHAGSVSIRKELGIPFGRRSSALEFIKT